MKKEYSVSEAARVAHMTSETLRHYDRIGLVRPSRRDENTQYRYYTEEDIVRLCTVHTLQQMDLPLAKIKEVLAYDDPAQIAAFFTQAEHMADEKIAALEAVGNGFAAPGQNTKANGTKKRMHRVHLYESCRPA